MSSSSAGEFVSNPGNEARGRWMALAAALLGWMFDGAEMGVFSLVGRSALQDLMPEAGKDQQGLWFSVIMAAFLVGAATGGVLFGWLGDRIGRVRAMTLSVLTYALFTGLCGVTASASQLGVLRFIAALGMGGEWSLGVALVMEVWPNRSRAFMAGLIGAFGNLGYLLVAVIGLGLASILVELGRGLAVLGIGQDTVDMLLKNQGWRLMMIWGTAPALLTFLIRLFVPESERWQRHQERGTTGDWQTRDLLGVLVGAAGPAVIIYLWATPQLTSVRLAGSLLGLSLAAAGYTYPALRYLQRRALVDPNHPPAGPTLRRMLLAASLAGVALLGTWGAAQWTPSWADKLTHDLPENAVAKYHTQIASAFGAIVGTLLAAVIGSWFSRRWTYCFLCACSLGSLLLLYQGNAAYGQQFLVCTFLVGACTASFYGWLPLYLPELFPTSVRATGQGFGFNFGRILAAVGTLQAGNLFADQIQIGSQVYQGGYPFACSVMSAIYLVGLGLIWLAPETHGKPLPE